MMTKSKRKGKLLYEVSDMPISEAFKFAKRKGRKNETEDKTQKKKD